MIALLSMTAWAWQLIGYQPEAEPLPVWVVEDGLLEEAVLEGRWSARSGPDYGQVTQDGETRLVPAEQLVTAAEERSQTALRVGALTPEEPVEAERVAVTGYWPALAGSGYLHTDDGPVAADTLLLPVAGWPGAAVFATQEGHMAWVGVVADGQLAAAWVPLTGTLREVTVLEDATLPGAAALLVVHSSTSSCPTTSVCSLVAWTGDDIETVRSVGASGEAGWYDQTSLFVPTRSGGWVSLEGAPMTVAAPVSPRRGYMVAVTTSGEPDEAASTEQELRSRVVFQDVQAVPWLRETP